MIPAHQQHHLQQQVMPSEHFSYPPESAAQAGYDQQRRVPPLQRRPQPIIPPSLSLSSAQPSQQTNVVVSHLSTQKETLSSVSNQQQQHQPYAQNRQLVVHEAFSISQLERKFMFLNEPSLRFKPNQAVDQIKQLWRVHHQQMVNMRPADPESNPDTVVEVDRPHSIDETGGQLGFSAQSQRPKEFDLFQSSVRNNLAELDLSHQQLRTKFKEAGLEIEKDILRVETLTGHVQSAFNDFILCFNSFVQREQRLETLHHQAIKKSQELSKKIQLEVMAQSSQRSQLLAIVDDLTEQLKQTKATTVKTQALQEEEFAHGQTRELLRVKERQIAELEAEIKSMNAGLLQLGQQAVQQQQESQAKQQQVTHLEGVIDSQQNEIEDLVVRRRQLEQEVSRLKSQVELTQSSKDKIILKLKQEMRLQAHQNSLMNGTLTNASGYAHQQVNMSSFHAAAGLNSSPQQQPQQYLAQQQQHQMPSSFRQQ